MRTSGGRTLRIDPAHQSPAPGQRRPDLPTRSTPPEPHLLDEFVYQHGQYFDSYLASEPEYERFWSSTGQGLISYVRLGRQVYVRGGLIAADQHKAELLGELLDFANRRRLRVHFLGIGESDLPLFRQHGFQVTKWGEEPIVDLTTCHFTGKPYEWVRRQSNYCTRMEVVATEVHPRRMPAEEWEQVHRELLEIAAESLQSKPQSGEMRFFEGQIDSHAIGHRRLFVARSHQGAGRIEGFLVCNPMEGGARWSTEMYRHRSDSVRGTVAFLFHQAMKQLQQEGVPEVNLCLVPGLHCHSPLQGDSLLVRKGFQFGQKYLGFIFDIAGLNHFKSRFRPRYESRYVCSTPTTSLVAILGFLHTLGVFQLSPRKTFRILCDRFRKRTERQTLALAD